MSFDSTYIEHPIQFAVNEMIVEKEKEIIQIFCILYDTYVCTLTLEGRTERREEKS